MQPHVTCAFVFTHYLWASMPPGFKPNDPERIKITYTDRLGNYVSKYYRLFNFWQSTDGLEYKVSFMRDEGGDNCEMVIRRKSKSDDAEVNMKHNIQHLMGLEHEFKLGKYQISNGRHYNSKHFKEYGLNLKSNSDPKKFAVTSEALTGKGNYITLKIDAEIL